MDINRSNKCIIYNLSFNSKKEFLKHTLTSEPLERTRELIDDEDVDSLIYKAEHKTETNAKIVTKAKTLTKAKTNGEKWSKNHTDGNIYTRIKLAKSLCRYECKDCSEKSRSKVALTTHTYSHNRNYLEDTEDYDINSSLIMREFYIIDKARINIEDIDEAIS